MSFMEKILDWNMENQRASVARNYGIFMEHLWKNRYGESMKKPTHWKITDWKKQRRAKMERYAKPTGKVEKCFGKL